MFHGFEQAPVQVRANVSEKRLFRFPLFSVPNVVVQNILLHKPATKTSGAHSREVLDRTKEFDYLRSLLNPRKKPDDRKNHV